VGRDGGRPRGDLAELPLPEAGHLGAELGQVLLARRSRYHFGSEPLRLDALATLLRFAAGLQRIRTTADGHHHPLGVAPAAGGLPVMQTHVVAARVDGLAAGVYRYDMATHALQATSPGDPTARLRDIYLQRRFADTAPVTLAMSADLAVAFGRYSLDHYRIVHVDAGILTQNLYLVSTALDLAGCAIVGFHGDRLADLLACPPGEIPLVLFPVGLRARSGRAATA
jgi:SagB-type dehydrogenase family enzyme